ncbi:hypothetical protein ScPMuIL_011927 [Solemya velum]
MYTHSSSRFIDRNRRLTSLNKVMKMESRIQDNRKKEDSVSARLTNALATLKRELIAMRSQDIKLMKQLININETIRKLVADRVVVQSPVMGNRYLSRSMSMKTSVFHSKKKTPLIRQQSEPLYCKLGTQQGKHQQLCSSSSFSESTESMEDNSFASFSELDDSTYGNYKHTQSNIPRVRSFSHCPSTDYQDLELVTDDTKYEEILRRNIRLWKLNQKDDNDSVFEEDGELDYLKSEVERMFC